MIRGVPFALVASLFVASVAHAQGTPIEKCTGNFEEAQLKEKRGKLIEAEQLFAACADTKCPAMIRADCSSKRDEMLRRIPTITVVVRDASGNDLQSYVEVDGKPMKDRVHAQPIDPGEHIVNYRAEGKKPATQRITVVEGEKARVISISAKEDKHADPNVPEPQTTTQPVQESHSVVAPIIVGSIGVLALVAAVGLQVVANSEDDKADTLQNAAVSPDLEAQDRSKLQQASDSRKEAAKSNQLVALLVGAGGLVFIASGVVLYFVTKPSPSRSKASFSPVVAPGYAGLAYGLRF